MRQPEKERHPRPGEPPPRTRPDEPARSDARSDLLGEPSDYPLMGEK